MSNGWKPKSAKPVADGWRPKSAVPISEANPEIPEAPAWKRYAHTGAEALPTLGMIAGGLLGAPAAGPPGAIGGAALGGAGGEAWRQNLNRALGYEAPQAPAEAGKQIGKAGLIGAATEIGGRGVAKLAGKAVGPMSRKAASFLAAKTESALRVAEKKGLMLDAGKVVDALRPFESRAQAIGKSAVESLDKFKADFLATRPQIAQAGGPAMTTPMISPTEAHTAKEFFDSMARSVHEAKKVRGTYIGPAEKQTAQWAEAMANRLRDMLRKEVPGYREAMAQEAKNLGRRKTTQVAARMGAGVAAMGGLHAIPAVRELPWHVRLALYAPAMAAGGWAANPLLLSRLAEFMTSPMGQAAMGGTVSNVARAGAAAGQP
jgi:hypothetical protein